MANGRVVDDKVEAELMERIRGGDVAAFEVLVDRYWSPTLRYSQHLSGDSERAFDIAQEAFTRLWAKRGDWVPAGSVRVWLLRTARNLVITDQRRWRVRTTRALQVAQEFRAVRTPLQDAESRELGTAIDEAVRKLSPRRKEVFTLFHLQGLSYREVAAVMQISTQTVANYLRAALADLRVQLAPHFQATPRSESSAISTPKVVWVGSGPTRV